MEINRHNLFCFFAFGAVFVVLTLFIFLWRRRNKKEKQFISTQSELRGELTERARISRDLHDGLGGLLSVLKLYIEKIQEVSLGSVEVKDNVSQALRVVDKSIYEVHRVSNNLMPDLLTQLGLKNSLVDFCKDVPNLEFNYIGLTDRFNPKLEMILFLSAHELVNNALKHAIAEHIILQIVQEPSRISLTIEDDGVGFNVPTVAKGIGLKNIRDRVALYNGKLGIWSEPGKGTGINIEFKLNKL